MARTGLRQAGLWSALALGLVAAPARAETACADLASKTFAAAEIGLPTHGGKVTSAEVVTSDKGITSYCKVVGEIAPVDPKAPPVRFQVNLPEPWNGKALQLGGGGLNGTLVTATGSPADYPPGPTPLQRGYATFGTDGGHTNDPPPLSFGLNDEALANHAYGAYKKTHDVAVALIKARYGKGPSKTYFYGSSEGGREAMIVVQRFPADYDGSIALAPLMNFMGHQLTKMSAIQTYSADSGFSEAQVNLLVTATRKACDEKDGLKDGIASQYRVCTGTEGLDALACPAGVKPGDTCLAPKQIAWVKALRSPYRYSYPLANGQTAYPSFGIGGEAQAGGIMGLISGKPALETGIVRTLVMKQPDTEAPFDEKANEARVKELSKLMDATDMDLSKFEARGGKLIMKVNGSDYTLSPYLPQDYYRRLVTKFGQARTDTFVRLYVNPGVNHFGSGVDAQGKPVPDRIDWLTMLDAWAEKGVAPGTALATSYEKAAPFAVVASRPVCRYPAYPRYNGSGDPKAAASFTCTPN